MGGVGSGSRAGICTHNNNTRLLLHSHIQTSMVHMIKPIHGTRPRAVTYTIGAMALYGLKSDQ